VQPLLLDTSAAVALVDPGSPHHDAVVAATTGRTLGLSGRAMWETLSELTRLPVPHRMSGPDALRLITVNVPESRHLDPAVIPGLLAELVAKGIIGGAVWDGLVAAAARAHGLLLLTADRRAQQTYEALQVNYQFCYS
jgi:predicted nucleic acid-binding protein